VADLRLDLDRLGEARSTLARVSDRLDGADDTSRHLPDAAGHPRLAGALTDFRDAWSVHRDDLLEELRFLREATGAIVDTFAELDAELAARAEHFLDVANETPGGDS